MSTTILLWVAVNKRHFVPPQHSSPKLIHYLGALQIKFQVLLICCYLSWFLSNWWSQISSTLWWGHIGWRAYFLNYASSKKHLITLVWNFIAVWTPKDHMSCYCLLLPPPKVVVFTFLTHWTLLVRDKLFVLRKSSIDEHLSIGFVFQCLVSVNILGVCFLDALDNWPRCIL